MPNLLKDDFSKADFPKLREDMIKWYESMPKTAVEFWEQYLQTADQNKYVQPNDEWCPIFILKNECKRPSKGEEDSNEQPSVNLRFREKEIAPLEQVWF